MSTRHNSRDRELEEAKQPKRNKERKKESETNKKPRRIHEVGFRISHSFQFPLIPLNSISLSFHNPHLPNTHTKIHRRRER